MSFIGDVKNGLMLGFWLLLGGTLLARAMREALNRRKTITITYPAGRRVGLSRGLCTMQKLVGYRSRESGTLLLRYQRQHQVDTGGSAGTGDSITVDFV